MSKGRPRKWIKIEVELTGEHEVYINGNRANEIPELDILEVLNKHKILLRPKADNLSITSQIR